MSRPARLVLVGGGHSHLEVLRRQILEGHPGISLTLVSPVSKQHYSGMVPGFVAGTYGEKEIAFDLIGLSERANARFLEGQASSIDPSRRVLGLADGTQLEYDLISFAIGSAPRGRDLPGVREHAWTVKPIHRAVALGAALRALALRPQAARAAIVGAGAGGVEIACAAHAVLSRTGRPPQVTILESGEEILSGYSPRFRRRTHRVLERKRFSIMTGVCVSEVRPESVRLTDGREIASDVTLWLTGPEPHKIFRGSGLSVDDRGYLLVDDSLRCVSDPRVFGAGDCATLAAYPGTPKAGVYAVREGPVLWNSLVAEVEGTARPRYRPQEGFLSILNTSDGKALLRYRGFVSRSRWAWRLKDWIDRRFMAKYQSLAAPPPR